MGRRTFGVVQPSGKHGEKAVAESCPNTDIESTADDVNQNTNSVVIR